MRSFYYTGLADGEAKKIVGQNVAVEINYTGATTLIVCVKGGFSTTNLTEIVDQFNDQITRATVNGDGKHVVNISGLTPGSFICGSIVSGTGTISVNLITGSEL